MAKASAAPPSRPTPSRQIREERARRRGLSVAALICGGLLMLVGGVWEDLGSVATTTLFVVGLVLAVVGIVGTARR